MWRPAETAPTDGTHFDAWCVAPGCSYSSGVRITDIKMRGDNSGFGFIVHLPRGDVYWQYLDARANDSIYPEWIMTHWMPRPAGPFKE